MFRGYIGFREGDYDGFCVINLQGEIWLFHCFMIRFNLHRPFWVARTGVQTSAAGYLWRDADELHEWMGFSME